MTDIGFMVWNPDRGMPTMVHPTIEQASAEADRLTRLNPGERFIIMSPVLSAADALAGKAFSAGARYAKASIEGREARALSLMHSARDSEAATKRRFERVEKDQRRFQSIVADCLLWFDGFAGAFAQREEWERPRIPNRDDLRDLNRALQDLERPSPIDDEEIPF